MIFWITSVEFSLILLHIQQSRELLRAPAGPQSLVYEFGNGAPSLKEIDSVPSAHNLYGLDTG